jgi:glycosyltransferase involved in cell wall biosynthesis
MRHLLRYLASRYYRTAFGIARLCGNAIGIFRRRAPAIDLVFVVPEEQRGWILEGIAKEIARYFPGTYRFHRSLRSLPDAKAYFFAHYSSITYAYKLNPHLWRRSVFVWYTHPRDDLRISEREMHYILKRATLIFCTCRSFVQRLHDKGVPRAVCVLGGADPKLFFPRDRGGGKVGFCTAFYARKRPDRVLEIVRSMPHRQFLLLGRHWDQYEKFPELRSMPNFEYVETTYDQYPRLYGQMDVFVSPSELEGGPVPLIEAMMSNVVPVASKTGFAPDVIRHGENGFLFETDAPVEVVCDLIDRAMMLTLDVRMTVLDCSWKAFSEKIIELMGFGPAQAEAPEMRPVPGGEDARLTL